MTPQQEHALDWNDRLQDWLDGDLGPEDAQAVEAHLASCSSCCIQLGALQQLDSALRKAAPHISLDDSFDARIFARIDSIDEANRAAARRRVEQELRENMQALARGWRRTLAFVIPGVIGGVALAFALTSYLLSADAAQPIIENAETIVRADSALVEMVLTAFMGAVVGGAVARWLASAAE